MLRLHTMKVQSDAPETYQESQNENNNNNGGGGDGQKNSGRLITIDDEPLRVPFKTS